jgi:hypothetical protein
MSGQNLTCREWQGARTAGGYGERKIDGKMTYVHRWVWEQVYGPIPPGSHVMHSCDNPPCFLLAHLSLGTAATNGRDASAKRRFPAQHRTHCPQGHEYTEENTIINRRGHRKCRACKNEGMRRLYAKKRGV